MYSSSFTSAISSIFAGGMILISILSLVFLALSIISTIGLWKVFNKAGKGGWESIIPFYSTWVLVEISGLNWWWFLISVAPAITSFAGLSSLSSLAAIASIFASFNCYYNLAKKFNKDTGFAVCLTLFNFICIPILGFSKDNVYNNNINVSKNGIIGANDSDNF